MLARVNHLDWFQVRRWCFGIYIKIFWRTNLTINYKKVHLLLNMSTTPYYLLMPCIKGENKIDSKFCEVCHIRKEQKCHMGSWRLMGSWKPKDWENEEKVCKKWESGEIREAIKSGNLPWSQFLKTYTNNRVCELRTDRFSSWF